VSYGWLILLISLAGGCMLFFSANNVALRSFSRLKLKQAIGSRDSRQRIEKIAANNEKLILTCTLYRLICIIIVLLLLVVLYTRLKNDVHIVLDYIIIFSTAVVIFMIFGLTLPHAWAKYAGEKIISKTYGFLIFLSTISWPVLPVYRITDKFVRRLAAVSDITPEKHREDQQEEFLAGLETPKMAGIVDEEQRLMIEKVIKLSDITAGEIMTPRTDIAAVDVKSDRKAILETIIGAGYSRVPVYEDNIDNIVGVIFAKDLLRDFDKPSDQFSLKDKIRQAYFVPETKSVRHLLREFQNLKLHLAIVLDEYGGTAGVITLEDIIEQLVGEIADEYEERIAEPIEQIDEDTIEVDARTYVDDLNDRFRLSLPENEDYDTVGGFVLSYLGYIPRAGVSFDYDNLRFSISSAESRRIKRITITRTGPIKNAE
jgi:CBS domain containing-hemolysin-like protein